MVPENTRLAQGESRTGTASRLLTCSKCAVNETSSFTSPLSTVRTHAAIEDDKDAEELQKRNGMP
jgi:hypothetical protein